MRTASLALFIVAADMSSELSRPDISQRTVRRCHVADVHIEKRLKTVLQELED